MRDRQWRRFQKERVRNNVEKWARFSGILNFRTEDEIKEWICKSTDTPHPCSAHCCGNPRKWFGQRTIQELKADIKTREQILDKEIRTISHKDDR